MLSAREAENLAIQYGIREVQARSEMLQGNILQLIGEYTRAINKYLNASKIYSELENELYVGYCYHNMANTYKAAGHYQSAIDFYNKYKNIKNDGSVNKGIGDTLLLMGQTEKALELFDLALELYRSEEDSLGAALVRNSQGDAFLMKNDGIGALASYEEALALSKNHGQSYTGEYSIRGKAKALLQLGDPEEALTWANQAFDLAERRDEKEAILSNLELKANISAAQNNFSSAFELLSELRELEIKYRLEKDSTQLMVMQALFDSEAKAAEIAELEEQNKILQLKGAVEKERSQQTQFIAFTLVCALLTLAFWIFTVSREKQRLAKVSAELEKAKVQAETATHTKSAFLANMSHEIRTPLTSIIGYADSILQGDIPEKEEHRVIKIICENGNHLLNVISDILDFTKIEANKLEFENIATPLIPLLAQIESVTGKRARDKGLSFDLHFRYPLPSAIITDPTRLRQILFNLTNNALKFTDKGSINVSVKSLENQLLIGVRDTGIGISKANQQALFQPFQQADGSINRRFGGSGLGLSISRHLAQGLGGDLTVSSEEGKGSEFVVAINLQPAPDCRWITSGEEARVVTQTVEAQKQTLPKFNKAKVLLAEDHPNNRELIRLMLSRMGLMVTDVENGLLACNAALKEQFDLVFLDIQMPVMDGGQALKQIKKAYPDTPVIALTANNMKHEVEQYMREGFTAHLPKPLPREDLIALLEHYLADFLITPETKTTTSGMQALPVPKGATPLAGQEEDMVKLIASYASQLNQEVEQAVMFWQAENWPALSELAHTVKGSAANFGFANIGEHFNQIEQQLKTRQYPQVSQLINQALGDMQLINSIPGTDKAVGIHNHSVSFSAWHSAMKTFFASLPPALDKMQQEAVSESLELASSINELQKQSNKLAFPKAYNLCMQIRKAIREGQGAEQLINACDELANELISIKSYLDSHSLSA
ncbi:tetratricopeptide repeat-containing hybrid sensor histidine kinase/response regulator [Planctobacterium marinum]|uniref:tetratricopeptide repeat-containing hybrid sensor histidine kinase/response regulator n=2 Tax=Planctobacterium marinum TaxID=1631968 RepID=UPI0030DAD5C0|nr:response regulator [Planctobacterium marinum]